MKERDDEKNSVAALQIVGGTNGEIPRDRVTQRVRDRESCLCLAGVQSKEEGDKTGLKTAI